MNGKKKSKNKRIRRKVGWGLFLTCLIAYILILPRPLFDTPYSTVIYSREGELLGARVAEDGQWRFPPEGKLPSKYIRAVTEYEDKRFYKHFGVSIPSLLRATAQNAKAGEVVSGGSTLTMQVVRLSRENPPRTYGEKLQEMILATRIECQYSKREILEMYAAHAPFGGNTVGVEAAAWRYFGHGLNELSWAEAATLAVLPNSPGLIHPGRGRERLEKKRNGLLADLLKSEAIDSLDYELACLEPLPGAPQPVPRSAPHLTDRLPHGTALHATLSASLQDRTQQIIDHYGQWVLAGNRIRNAAALVADIRTGEVLAYVGNITPSADSTQRDGRSVDIIQSRRSTGSLLKPILFGALLNEGDILPGTLVFDTPLNIAGFTPTNYSGTFSGAVPARDAISRSLNVPVVRMLTQYNNGRFLDLLRSMGMTTFDRHADHYGSTLILGGAESTLWELSALYTGLGNSLLTGSREMKPLFYRLGEEPAPIGKQTLSPAALWFMFQAMAGVNRPEEEAAWQEFRSMKQVAWKTGTSYGNRDAWAVGLTPGYLVGVWVGNADGEGRASMTGVGSAAPILFDIFSMLPEKERWFKEPAGDMEPMEICSRSGHRASEWCVSSGDPVDRIDMPAAGLASPLCPYHKPVKINEGVVKGWFVLPPAAEYYYRQISSDYVSPPASAGSRPLELIYPQHNAVLYLPRGFEDGERRGGQFVFRAAHRDNMARIHWHLNDRYLATTRPGMGLGHTLTTALPKGNHLLTLVDDSGHRQAIRFTVRER